MAKQWHRGKEPDEVRRGAAACWPAVPLARRHHQAASNPARHVLNQLLFWFRPAPRQLQQPAESRSGAATLLAPLSARDLAVRSRSVVIVCWSASPTQAPCSRCRCRRRLPHCRLPTTCPSIPLLLTRACSCMCVTYFAWLHPQLPDLLLLLLFNRDEVLGRWAGCIS